MRLAEMYEGRISVLDIADFAVHIPRGSLVAEWFGGWGAITSIDESIRRVEYAVVAANSSKKPPIPDAPKGLREIDRDRKKQIAMREKRRRALASMSARLQESR